MPFGDERPNVTIDVPDEGNDIPAQSLSGTANVGPSGELLAGTYLELEYSQPDIEVNSSANYVDHNVFGDVTVRQKTGESPDQISMTGICTEEEANLIDNLPAFDYVDVLSSRWSGFAQVASTNTSPYEEAGAQRGDGQWLHSFTIELVEVTEV